MGPFGSDTRRYDMHCKCHSTSICHSWGTFFHFPAIVFHYFDENCFQSDVKLTPYLHKIIYIVWGIECFSKLDRSDSKATLMYPKSYKSDPKVNKRDPQSVPKWHQSAPNRHFSLNCSFRESTYGYLDPSQFDGKMNIFCLWARLGRTQGDMICIASAFRRLYATLGVHFFTFRPLPSIILMKIVSKAMSS